MWFRLAALWGCTVREAQRRCDAREFNEWLAYYRLEPWGEERDDLRSGIVASVIANCFRGKGQKAFKPKDFMPRFDKPEEPDWRATKSLFKAAQSAQRVASGLKP